MEEKSIIDEKLPELFEEFETWRQDSFLKVKEEKEKGTPIIGVFCTYFPEEFVMAMNAATVSLCSMSQETIPDAEKDLPKNLCPLVKSSYGFAKTDKCPFFYFADLIIGETTCDGKKKMYELLGAQKPVYVMELPNCQSESGLVLWKKELLRMKRKLEEVFDTTISEEKLREAVWMKNEMRMVQKEFYGLMKLEPPPMTGSNMYDVLYSSGYSLDKTHYCESVRTIIREVMQKYEKEKDSLRHRPRILVTGSPLGGATQKVIDIIEEEGGVVVAYENCGGAKAIDQLTDEENPDVYEALAKRYLDIGCSCMTPNIHRIELLRRLIREFRVDGVVDMILHAWHTYNVESRKIESFVKEEFNIPYLKLETDYSEADIGQINLRVSAFMEMIV